MNPRAQIAASVRDRLKNQVRREGGNLQTLLEEFALSRFFARLARSDYRERLILKGAQLFRLWSDQRHRPTRDADFLGFGEPSPASLERIFNEIAATPTEEEDGLLFDPVSADSIRDDNPYGGIRLKMTAILGTMRMPLQFDVGFGDVITPAIEQRKWSGMLDYPDTLLISYPVETVIAEKLEAMVSLAIGNSRMKDFFDLHWLATHLDLDRSVLHQAIRNTFARRETPLPEKPPVAYTAEFVEDSQKREQWSAFLRKNKLQAPDLPEVIHIIQARFPLPL